MFVSGWDAPHQTKAGKSGDSPWALRPTVPMNLLYYTDIIVFVIKRPIFWGLGMLSHSHVMLLKPIGGQWPFYVWMAALESVACACCMRTHAFRLLQDFLGSFFRSQSSLGH